MIELIFGYVDLSKQKDQWYQLEVINMWDWSTKPICFHDIQDHLISYCLKLCTPKSHDSYHAEIVNILPEHIKSKLIESGYTIVDQKG